MAAVVGDHRAHSVVTFEAPDFRSDADVHSVLAHPIGDPGRLALVEGQWPEPILANVEAGGHPGVVEHLHRLDADQPAADDHRRARWPTAESPRAGARPVGRGLGRARFVGGRSRRPAGVARAPVELALEPLAVLEGDEVTHPGKLRARPGRSPGAGTAGDQQPVVGHRLRAAAEEHAPLPSIEAHRSGADPMKSETLVDIALVGLDAAMAELAGDHPHEGGAAEEVVRLLADQGDVPVGLPFADDERRFDAGDAVADDDRSHGSVARSLPPAGVQPVRGGPSSVTRAQ